MDVPNSRGHDSGSMWTKCSNLHQAFFFNTFMVAGVVGHYRFVEFWSQKAWVFSQNAWVFSPEPLSFFQSTGILKIWSQIFEKMAVFCRKFAQKVPNIAFFRRASRKFARFGLISKNAENGMSFEIHLATITTGSLSFGLKNPWVFWTVEFFRAWVFSKMLKKRACTKSCWFWWPFETSNN